MAKAASAGKQTEVAAHCLGVDVPPSPFLNEKRIERINAAQYEGQEIAGALAVVRKGDRVLELGAGLGIVGAVVAKNRKPAKMMSFEANPELIPHIRALYELNGLKTKIALHNKVLISSPERPVTMSFHIHNSYLGSSLGGQGGRRVDVPTASYEDVRKSLKPDVMIMDIEGGELAFLEHADLSGVRAMVIEFHPKAYGVSGMRRCKNILRDAGFIRADDLSTRMVWVAQKADRKKKAGTKAPA